MTNNTTQFLKERTYLVHAGLIRAGEVVRRDELLEEVWGSKDYITMRTVDNHVASLRAKLEEKASKPTKKV